MVYVTHDLNVLREIASHVAVMYAGSICEIGPLPDVFTKSRHPYTRALIAAAPDISAPERQKSALEGVLQRDQLSSGCLFSHRCSYVLESCRQHKQALETVEHEHRVACQRWRELDQEPAAPVERRGRTEGLKGRPILAAHRLGIAYQTHGVLSLLRSRPVKVVEDIALSLSPGVIVALVGESGSGKSTIAKTLSGSLAPCDGQIEFDGRPLPGMVKDRTIDQRRRIQLIFQNPDSSLNTRRRVGDILGGALQSFYSLTGEERQRRAKQALTEVQLPSAYMERFPTQLSGGERQRVAIARALIVNPDVLLCDEILSALDVSVQAGILNLLKQLVESRRLSILFISHDLSVVRALADRILVLFRGRLVESGPTEEVFDPPFHPYLFSLLAALPGQAFVASSLPPRVRPVASGPHPGSLCIYLDRCSFAQEPLCTRAAPPLQRLGAKQLLCHLHPTELSAQGYLVGRDQRPRPRRTSHGRIRSAPKTDRLPQGLREP
jgi:peptide/nickel transport system ATP-binding protein